MSLFGKLLGTQGRQPDPEALQFDAEWHQAVRRFARVSGLLGYQLNLRHPKTREIMLPHEGLEGDYEAWRARPAPLDRRRIFFLEILEMGANDLPFWAFANGLAAIGHPQDAWELLQKHDPPDASTQYFARHAGAYARVLLGLGQTPEALTWAQAATAADPEDPRLQLLLADALRLSGQNESASAIYAGLMATAEPTSADAPDPVGAMFASLFAGDSGAVPSPLFALDIAGQIEDPAQAERFWQLGEAEFCDSAQFRMHHAYRLVQTGQVLAGLDKLAAVVQEFPWLREPSLNLRQLLQHLDPTGSELMPDLRARVEKAIQDNGWTPEGLALLQVPVDPAASTPSSA
jgi:hypothetical protein